jgi:uncharacterized protein (TIGR02246 family)
MGILVAGAYLGAQTTGPPRQATTNSRTAKEASRPEDEKAIRDLVDAFTKAFNAGDAKSIGTLFAEDADVVDEKGNSVRGREGITELFTGTFGANPGARIEVTPEALRFLGPDTAMEEGRSKMTPAKGGSPEFSRYSALYAKRNGRWLQTHIREHVDHEVTPHERLRDLEWMIGEWVDEGVGSVVFTTVDWAENKNYLVRSFTYHIQGKPAMSGSQRIGWDPLKKQIKSWIFDSEGGYGDGLWSRSGDQWIVKATYVLPDGRTASATQTISPLSRDMVRWKSSDRTVGGTAVPDEEEVVLVRKPPKPR